jgi:hypothetical protein
MRGWILSCTMLVAVASGAARAQIYEWRDESGAKHFSNNLQSIPEERRSVARVMIEDKSTGQGGREAPKVAVPDAGPGEARAAARRARKDARSTP